MKMILLIISLLLLAVAGYLYFDTSNPKKETQGNVIYYYPKANVYLDEENQTYLLLVNGKWERSKTLTEEQISFLGKQVAIEKPSVPVWRDNEHHRLIYGTALYNSPEEYKRKYYEDSINSLPKKVTVAPAPKDSVQIAEQQQEEERKRSGVQKFFDKLFKKKAKASDTSKN